MPVHLRLHLRPSGVRDWPLSLTPLFFPAHQEEGGSEGTSGGRVMPQKLASEASVPGHRPCTALGISKSFLRGWTRGGCRGVWDGDHQVVLESWVLSPFLKAP